MVDWGKVERKFETYKNVAPIPYHNFHGVLCKMGGVEINMREIARFEGNSIYSDANVSKSKGNFTKLPIILCAIAGILIGGLAFRAANGKISIEALAGGGTTEGESGDKKADTLGLAMDIMFKAFGMDRYNPITILNSNSPFFEEYYKKDYLKFVAEKEQEELQKKIVQDQELQPAKTQETQAAGNTAGGAVAMTQAGDGFKEASSSITFEGDVDSSDQENNPVVTSGKIKVVNETKYNIDINKLLKEPLKLNPAKTGPQIFVYHTHTTESFLKNIGQLGDSSVPSRTTDSKYNVVRVGDALIANLQKLNVNVLHNKTIHDKDYNSSYGKSLSTLTDYVGKYPSLKMTIDLHRDAAGSDKLRVVKKINGKDYAQIMFVIGTDSKLSNPKWKENLKLALKIQSRLNEIAPGIAKPTYISKNRYNQHLTNGSVIIEVGGDGNVIDECVRSTTYLAQAINDVIYKNKY